MRNKNTHSDPSKKDNVRENHKHKHIYVNIANKEKKIVFSSIYTNFIVHSWSRMMKRNFIVHSHSHSQYIYSNFIVTVKLLWSLKFYFSNLILTNSLRSILSPSKGDQVVNIAVVIYVYQFCNFDNSQRYMNRIAFDYLSDQIN